MKLLLITLSVLFLIPNFFKNALEKTPQYSHYESYDPQLSYINSIDKLIFVADSIATPGNIKQGSLPYALIINKIISNHFFHGFSHFTLDKNWIAAAGEYCFGHNLSCIVKADDILKYGYAGCSQQAIVLIEAMKRKNIPYRSVGFPHHYALQLKLDEKWYFFDPNMEPVISDSERTNNTLLFSADSIKKYYDRKHFTDLDWKFGNGKPALGKENAVIAPNAKIFHTSSFYLSKTLWLFPLMLAFYPRKKSSPSLRKFRSKY